MRKDSRETFGSPITILGTGLAGYTLAREFRKLDQSTPLTLITGDNGDFYSKPMLSSALGKHQSPADLVTASATRMAETLQADIHCGVPIQTINSESRQLKADSTSFPYRRLVLALGASPIPPPVSGNGIGEICSINNLSDYRSFRARLARAHKVAIIGPGLIGCEFANDLMGTGLKVSVIGPDPYPISTLLPESAARSLQTVLAGLGVTWHLGVVAERVERTDAGLRIALSDGTQLEADLVLSAIGLRPETTLAKRAGLSVNRGIVTGRRLQTSTSGIYALGDCAEVAGLNLPFVMPIMHGARALAQTLAGTPTNVHYPAMPVVIKTFAHPVVVSPPAKETPGEWQSETLGNGVRALFLDPAGRLLGFALTGEAVKEKQRLTQELPPVLSARETISS